VDTKAAIIEEFRERASILIATEAAAEGVNLQFCSLVVNYDLPWNPQRIEQRIGRCHRYGQEHDVVVVNFLNRRNAADQRVFQLLSEKFRLFDGVFGASDEVLGALESGVDIEKRIAQVYQECRTPEEITDAFDALQAELDEQIQGRMDETRKVLLEHFDEEVHARLEVHRDLAQASLNERERWLLALTRAELTADATFAEDEPRFHYRGPVAQPGFYHLKWQAAEHNGDTFYRVDHPLAASLIERAATRALPDARITYDYAAYGANVAALQPLLGQSGWLELSKLSVTSLQTEEFLVFAATSDAGEVLDADQCAKLFNLPACAAPLAPHESACGTLKELRERAVTSQLADVEARNARLFDEEVAKLDRWTDDLKLGLEFELKELNRAIKEARRSAALAAPLSDKLEAQRALKALEQQRSRKRRALFDEEDRIDRERDELIESIGRQLQARHEVTPLFAVRWTLN
jgi:hypothetical protein